MTGNECCRCGQHLDCPHCEDTREVATVSDDEALSIYFCGRSGEWRVMCSEGDCLYGESIEVEPAARAVLCKALGLVPAAIVAALETLLLAHAGTPRECGLDAETWQEAARLEARS